MVCEAIIKDDVVKKVLKTSVAALVELNMLKNLAGSAVAGALGVTITQYYGRASKGLAATHPHPSLNNN